MKGRWLGFFAAQAALTLVLFVAFVAAVGDAENVVGIFVDSETWLFLLGLFAGVSVTQLVLVAPVLARRPRRARGVPVWTSIFLGSTLFAVLLGTFVAALGQALFDEGSISDATGYAALAVTGAAWVGGTTYFAIFMRAHPNASREGLLQLMARRLLQLSVFEALANIPLDAMIRKKSNCHCGDASVAVWAACVAVGLVVFGPAVFLTFVRKAREPWYRERCDACATPSSDAVAGTYRDAPAKICAACGHAMPVRAA